MNDTNTNTEAEVSAAGGNSKAGEKWGLKLSISAESGRMVRGNYELHCGDGFDLFHAGQWHCVCIEHTNRDGRSGPACVAEGRFYVGWYLIFAGSYDDAGNFTRYPRRTGWAVDYVGCTVRRER